MTHGFPAIRISNSANFRVESREWTRFAYNFSASHLCSVWCLEYVIGANCKLQKRSTQQSDLIMTTTEQCCISTGFTLTIVNVLGIRSKFYKQRSKVCLKVWSFCLLTRSLLFGYQNLQAVYVSQGSLCGSLSCCSCRSFRSPICI